MVSEDTSDGTYRVKLLHRKREEMNRFLWVFPCTPLMVGTVIRGTPQQLDELRDTIPIFHVQGCQTDVHEATERLVCADQFLRSAYRTHIDDERVLTIAAT